MQAVGSGARVRALAYGLLASVFTTLAIGVPTDVVPTSLFTRMTPVRVQDYLFLAVTALLAGLLAASYAVPRAAACQLREGRTALGGLLSFLAVGCPTCNKVVVLLLGTSGALTWFEPLQPLLAALSTLLLATAVWLRWRPLLRPATAAG